MSSTPFGTPEEQSPFQRGKRWFLIEGDRLLVTGLIMAGFYALVIGLTAVDVVGYLNDGALTRIASGMIAGTFSLITIVLTINQLILSREMGHAGRMREQMETTFELREEVEREARIPVSPEEPIAFLQTVVRTVRENGRRLRELVRTEGGGDFGDQVESFADDVVHEAAQVEDLLVDVDIQSMSQIADILEYEQAFGLMRARELRRKSTGEMPEATTDALESLISTQHLFMIVQSYTRTMYLQQELARLSRMMLYVGIPAASSSLLLGLIYGEVPASIVYPTHLPLVVPVLLTAAFGPLALLAAYMIRISTLTQRTSIAGTFLP